MTTQELEHAMAGKMFNKLVQEKTPKLDAAINAYGKSVVEGKKESWGTLEIANGLRASVNLPPLTQDEWRTRSNWSTTNFSTGEQVPLEYVTTIYTVVKAGPERISTANQFVKFDKPLPLDIIMGEQFTNQQTHDKYQLLSCAGTSALIRKTKYDGKPIKTGDILQLTVLKSVV